MRCSAASPPACVHDLSHPIQNIGNSTRLLLRDDLDLESREQFRRTIERELQAAEAVHGRPAARRQAEADRTLRDGRQRLGRRDRRVDARRRRAQRRRRRDTLRAGTARHRRRSSSRSAASTGTSSPTPSRRRSRADASPSPPARAGDRVEIQRHRHRLGHSRRIDSRAIFDDFVTTKRRGLGLGLAISKRIVEQLNGTIDVQSEVGRGTAFTLPFSGARRSISSGRGKLAPFLP